MKWNFLNFIFGFLAEFREKFWCERCDMFLCVKGKPELPLTQHTLEPPIYEVKINVWFGFFCWRILIWNVSSYTKIHKTLTKHPGVDTANIKTLQSLLLFGEVMLQKACYSLIYLTHFWFKRSKKSKQDFFFVTMANFNKKNWRNCLIWPFYHEGL